MTHPEQGAYIRSLTCYRERCRAARSSRLEHRDDQRHCIWPDSRPACSRAIPVAHADNTEQVVRETANLAPCPTQVLPPGEFNGKIS